MVEKDEHGFRRDQSTDTALVSDAIGLSRSLLEPFLFSHVMREFGKVILAHLWQLTLAHLWQLAGQGRGMEMRCALGWSVAKARSTARASISPWSWPCLSR